jgi:hypothetical protein
VIVVDDSRRRGPDMRALRGLSDEVTVLTAPAARAGTRGGLWAKVAYGIRHVLRHYDFETLLRMDADALMIGEGADRKAIERFHAEPDVGLLGSFRIGWDGEARDPRPAARILNGALGMRGLSDPEGRRLLRELVDRASRSGFTAGDHTLGAAMFLSRAAVRAIEANGWFASSELTRTSLADDHLLSLLVPAAGFRVADFGRPGDPLALRWRGLPAAPDNLVGTEVSIVHSVRSYRDLDEAAIRGTFARHRAGASGDPKQGAARAGFRGCSAIPKSRSVSE